ncbi:unnamed protein product [Pleuronectes platessa]|uniref:CD80-like immunoglobulin C2-set domain-containing protein n=1 Tax=Pleuronectes platessa TaxID=8262 RepID=A0A9N7UN23_PLEPL|nr:unnamed protein product [Pleuronectes platessa]
MSDQDQQQNKPLSHVSPVRPRYPADETWSCRFDVMGRFIESNEKHQRVRRPNVVEAVPDDPTYNVSSELTLEVSRDDDNALITCAVDHPSLAPGDKRSEQALRVLCESTGPVGKGGWEDGRMGGWGGSVDEDRRCKAGPHAALVLVSPSLFSVSSSTCTPPPLRYAPNTVIQPESDLPREGEKFYLKCVGNSNPE